VSSANNPTGGDVVVAYSEDTVAELSEQQRDLKIDTDDLHPFVNYRNPQDDKVRSAIEEAVKRLKTSRELAPCVGVPEPVDETFFF